MKKEYETASDLYDIVEEAMHEKVGKDVIFDEGVVEAMVDFVIESASGEINAVKSYIRRMYAHMLKYIVQPYKQSSSWIQSIIDSQIELKSMLDNKSLRNKITDDVVQKAYKLAIESAYKDMRSDKNISEKDIPIDKYLEWDLEYILDSNCIDRFLINNAYTRDAKKYLGL